MKYYKILHKCNESRRLYHEQLKILPIIFGNSWKEMQTMKKEIIVYEMISIGSLNS